MKTKIVSFSAGTVALVVIGVLLAAGSMQGRQSTPPPAQPPPDLLADDAPSDPALALDDSAAQPPPTIPGTQAQPALAIAPTLPPPTPTGVQLSQGAADIARFAQSGIGEDVMLSYVASENSKFNLGSDQILYLNDLGVSGNVVKAMIQRDATIDANAQSYAASLAAASQPPQPPPMPDDSTLPPPPDDSNTQMPPYDPGSYVASDDAGYFYSSLAPYGNWTYVAGAGLCWQPTVFIGNHNWRPYCDRGRWVYSDCGWYWQSDYSWGWAPFHYGRWFRDAHSGWVWCPDRVWGPAWVSWRKSGDHCGWAPLPPSAHFVPGTGFVFNHHKVEAGFEFGLQAHNYTFIPIARLSDYAPARYAVATWDKQNIFNQTKNITQVEFQNNRVINRGVDPKTVSALAQVDIRSVEIRDLPHDGNHHPIQSDRMGKSGGNLVIYRPQLPAPSRVPTGNMISPGSRPAPVPTGHGAGWQKTSMNPPAPVTGQSPTTGTTVTTKVSTPQPGSSGAAIDRERNDDFIARIRELDRQAIQKQAAEDRQAEVERQASLNRTAATEGYPAGSLVLHGNPSANPARHPVDPAAYGVRLSGAPPETFHAEYNVVNGFARPANEHPEHRIAPNAPAASSSTYVVPARYSAAQHLSGNSPGYSVASPSQPQMPSRDEMTQSAMHVMPAHYSAAQQVSAPRENAHVERAVEAVSQHFESHSAPAPAPAPAASHSSPSSSSSSSSSSGRK